VNEAAESQLEVYSPINMLKPVADNVWIVDGPTIDLSVAGFGLPFTTRMTVVRLANGDLLLHSPTEWSAELQQELSELGPIQYLVAPNSLHYWWVPDWQDRLPNVSVVAVSGLTARAKRPLRVDLVLRGGTSPWPGEIDMVVVKGDVLTEAVLFHRASRTLILTDLIENFEPARIRGWIYRKLVILGGAADPDGKAPIDLQLTFLRHRRALRAAVRQMIAWQPIRIVISHGRWYERDGVRELIRAFRWVL
jgi:hypothetical protein